MAFRIAVSGLKAATADLNVTGNNIANGSTTGFKASRAQFADLFAAGSLGTTQNAVGEGVQLAAVAQQFTQGNVAFTDNSLDMAINGKGFFALDDSGTRVYSRAGAFGLDKNGFIVNAANHQLRGLQASVGVITGALGPLQITTTNLPPQTTGNVTAQFNLDAGDTIPVTAPFDPANPTTYNESTSLTVFDSLGEEHLATLFFVKTGANAWTSHLRVDNDNTQTLAAQPVAFNSAGVLTTAMPISYGAFLPTNGAAAFNMQFDFTGTTQFGADFGVNALSQDGFATGLLSGVDVDKQGVILARFSNGQSQAQGQIVLANFANPHGLQPLGDTQWAETNTSGAALVGPPGGPNLGLVQSGALEESNVELADQLVNMIIAQRNYQSNAQVIRAEDELTQTIINIS